MTRPRPQGTLRQKQPVIKDPGYMEYMKQLCLVHGCVLCGAPAERAHIRMGEVCEGCENGITWENREPYKCPYCNGTGYRFGKLPTGMSERDDPWCLPVCPNHHRLLNDAQHPSGLSERTWWAEKGIDPLALCKALQDPYDTHWQSNRLLAIQLGAEILEGVRSQS